MNRMLAIISVMAAALRGICFTSVYATDDGDES
jgi:hypothetical protein